MARRAAAAGLRLDQPHEQLFQTIDLVAHGQHADALRGQACEDFVEALFLGNLDLERVLVDELELIARHLRHGGDRLAQVQHESLRLQLAQQRCHPVALGNCPPSMMAMLRQRVSASSR